MGAWGRGGGGCIFVLSGFLITGILWGELQRHGGIRLGAFYARRAFRLVPALTIALVLVFPVVAVAIGEGDNIVVDTLAAMFYLTDLTGSGVLDGVHAGNAYWHTWSLAVEEQFYLVWPLLLPLLSRYAPRRPTQVMWICVAASLGAWLLSEAVLGFRATYYLPVGHLAGLVLGATMAISLSSRDPLSDGGHEGRKIDRTADLLAGGAVPAWRRRDRTVGTRGDVLATGDVGRVHLARWGEGGAHFHLWFVARPLGRLDMADHALPVWEDALPAKDQAVIDAVGEKIAAALVA